MKQDDTKIFKGDYYKWPEDDFTREMPGIAFASFDVIDHLKVFFRSLDKVGNDYYVFDLNEEKLKELAPRSKKKALKHTERVFAYELYHQWSSKICKTDGWVLNAELFKHLTWFYPPKTNETEAKISDQSYPDMVLHRGQQKDDQMIVCEIKRDYRVKKDILDDLIRLYRFTRRDNQQNSFRAYHCGIFLAVNAKMKVITENIIYHYHKLEKNMDFNSVDNIICIASNVNTIVFQSLGEIVRQLKRQGFGAKSPIPQLNGQPKKRNK